MKHISTIVLLLILSLGVSRGQNKNNILMGTWKNSYGSVLDINSINKDGVFTGIYGSSTGATGKYNIVGMSPPVPSEKESDASQPLSLAILWSPLQGATGAPNEEWTSSMTGQILLNKSGEWIMEVFHSLNASSPLPAVDIAQAGRYSETLIFKRISHHSQQISSMPARQTGKQSVPPVPLMNPLQGSWTGDLSDKYSHLEIDVVFDDKSQLGLLAGSLIRQGTKMTVLGFTAPDVPTGDVQSVALVFMGTDAHGSACYSANGFLHQTNQLKLTVVKSRVAPYASKYTATQITDKAVFYRIAPTSIHLTMDRNNFTNNGASEWTTNFRVGNSVTASILKFGLDTGGNFLWANSTQCTTKSCTGYRHIQFNPSTSSTFKWIDKVPKQISWGPWGNAMANSGSDYISFSSDYPAIRYGMKLITHFDETPQFDEFLWDGAIAFPANSNQMVEPTSNMLKALVDNKQIAPDKVCVAFYFSPREKTGLVTMGDWDSTLVDVSSKLVFKYQAYDPVKYLWCSPLTSFSIGDKQIASTGSYSFDTGSSALKGDAARMTEALAYANQVFKSTGKWPVMKFGMGVDNQGKLGTLELTSEQYVQMIEEGEHAGNYVPQIQTLEGTPNLYLQGSTMMNYVYTVFWWDAHPNAGGTYDLTAREVWLFNKKEGPHIIQKNTKMAFHNNSEINDVVVYPNPAHKAININFELTEKSNVIVTAHSTRGILLYKKEYLGLAAGENSLNIDDLYASTPLAKKDKTVILTLRCDEKTVLVKRVILY